MSSVSTTVPETSGEDPGRQRKRGAELERAIKDATIAELACGGYGSVMDLAKDGLTVVWPHCNMTEVGKGEFKPYAEPFSFVARAKSTGLLAALNAYIPQHKYEGTPNPPSVKCVNPPWVGK